MVSTAAVCNLTDETLFLLGYERVERIQMYVYESTPWHVRRWAEYLAVHLWEAMGQPSANVRRAAVYRYRQREQGPIEGLIITWDLRDSIYQRRLSTTRQLTFVEQLPESLVAQNAQPCVLHCGILNYSVIYN